MRVIGIDLSGPKNHKDTYLAVFEKQGNGLKLEKVAGGLSDSAILTEVAEQSSVDEVVIGMDAPLSYQDGGGDRPGDRSLRQFIVNIGMKSGSIMPPTLNRMVYITLRGIKLTREIEELEAPHPISIVEVHPGAIIGSRIAASDIPSVLSYKKDQSSRSMTRKLLEQEMQAELPAEIEQENHSIDACAAALGAWHWRDPERDPKWLHPAERPMHPYDYCC
ncbi:DUF429 domain-containing protein [Bacillus marinisedimentorum]|uniref:DUF429 domain-containing protein n=1 Tax=Bacillus marinisedimentorum TaxID=1821260 RepID=UPI0007E2042D|nr:DUF429 domain-containing protein [Bacillus marinisedimentorum]